MTIPGHISLRSIFMYEVPDSLKTIIISEGSTSVYSVNAKGIKTIIIPSSVKTIHSNAFYGITDLTSVIFKQESQLTTIGDYAFSYASNLESLTIPDSVTSIGYYAFAYMPQLDSIVINNPVPPTITQLFNQFDSIKIYVPDHVVETYKTTNGWSNYANHIFSINEISE